MPRPKQCRRISGDPASRVFKPAGIAAQELEVAALALEELEALRLSDMEGLYQEAAAECMGVSRATFGRVLQEARAKVAKALVRGMVIRIEGGTYEMDQDHGNSCCGRRRRNRRGEGDGQGQGCGCKDGGRSRSGRCARPGQAKPGRQDDGRNEEN